MRDWVFQSIGRCNEQTGQRVVPPSSFLGLTGCGLSPNQGFAIPATNYRNVPTLICPPSRTQAGQGNMEALRYLEGRDMELITKEKHPSDVTTSSRKLDIISRVSWDITKTNRKQAWMGCSFYPAFC